MNVFGLVTGELVTRWHTSRASSKVKGHAFYLFSPCKSINANYLINEAFYQIYFCVRTISRSKSTFVPKGIPIGFQMAEKNGKNKDTHTQTHTHIFVFIYVEIHLDYHYLKME